MLKALDFSTIKKIQSITGKLLTNCKSASSELDIIPFSGTTPFKLKGFFIWVIGRIHIRQLGDGRFTYRRQVHPAQADAIYKLWSR